MSVVNVLSIIGWGFLIMSWIVPYMMKDKMNKHFVGAVLAAFASGIFLSALVVNLIK